MFVKYLKSKLHGVKVTETNVNYSGSITIDKKLMDEANINPFEMVTVVNVSNAERFETYVIEAPEGSGYIGLNGGAAKKGSIDDRLIIFSSIWVKKGKKHRARVIIIGEDNHNISKSFIAEIKA